MKLSKITQVMMYPLMTVVLIAPLGTQAYDKGDWVLRAGTTTVTPNEDSSNVFVGGTDLGLGVSVENSTQLGLNVAYFFTPRWSLEVLAATPFSHDIELADVKLINAKQLPPSLTANYFAGFSNVDLDSSFGITAQVGFDFKIDKNWLFNASVRWIDIDTDATFDLNGNAGRVAVDIDPLVYTVSFGYRF
jgi:outer membrane protein